MLANPIGKILKNGFNTGHGQMREPKSINSAMSLASIIIQANFKFLYNQGVWSGGEELGTYDQLKEILKQGTLSVGFVGLAEALVQLTGEHHGESEEALKLLVNAQHAGIRTNLKLNGFVELPAIDFEELKKDPHHHAMLAQVDVLVDGRFELSKRDLSLYYKGSSNQRIINVAQSLGRGDIMLELE